MGKAGSTFTLYIETCSDEYCQSVFPDDLIAVSCPEGGPLEPAVMLLEFIRRYKFPLVVLPKNHPGSSRLAVVVAVGDEILLACDIQRGTHPEQNLICSSGELAGVHLSAGPGVVEIEDMPPDVMIECRKPYENRNIKEQ